MIRLKISLYPSGCLERFVADGHAGAGNPSRDIVCAAVTVLLRTGAGLLSGRPELVKEGDAPGPGEMFLLLRQPPEERIEWIKGSTDFLICGLRDLKTEYPEKISLEINGRMIEEN